MNLNSRDYLQLSARNEGKIKSYKSCTDLRAWSHDFGNRNRYLREWMKCNMPVNVIPVYALTRIFENMTCRSRGKTAPRCHRDCKSKVLLDSISKSCHAMRECLKENQTFEKYFQEEEFETSHWPCERCLDALKSLKMFWKIIVEKLFHANIPKEKVDDYTKSIHSLAKNWEQEIIKQTVYVKKVSKATLNLTDDILPPKPNYLEKKPAFLSDSNDMDKLKSKTYEKLSRFDRDNRTNGNRSSIKSQGVRVKVETSKPQTYFRSPCKKCNKCVHKKAITNDVACSCQLFTRADIGCDPCDFENEQNELKICKKNIDYLQKELTVQLRQIDKLKLENLSVKAELEKVYRKRQNNNLGHYPVTFNSHDNELVPKPFDSGSDVDSVKAIDSEMVITMKNCKNDTFKHVSLLQVLHKTNEPMLIENYCTNDKCLKKEDPLVILNKVHHTFGAMVKREVSVVKEERKNPKKISEINASIQKLDVMKSSKSFTTLSSLSKSTFSNFESAKTSDVDRKEK